MAYVLVLLVAILASYVVVRVGALALNLTGLDWEMSKFQALSAFSGTGFTTRDAELVVRHSQRRSIITVLILLGNAGLVTIIATLVGSLTSGTRWTESLLDIGVAVLGLLILYRLFLHKPFLNWIDAYARRRLKEDVSLAAPHQEELFQGRGGYGIVRVRLSADSPYVGKALIETDLRNRGIYILNIVDGEHFIAYPRGSDYLHAGAYLICYGRLDAVRALGESRSPDP